MCQSGKLCEAETMLKHGKNKTVGSLPTPSQRSTLDRNKNINPQPPILGGSLAGRQLKRCCLLRHQEGLGEVSLSTPYPPFGPVPLTDAK